MVTQIIIKIKLNTQYQGTHKHGNPNNHQNQIKYTVPGNTHYNPNNQHGAAYRKLHQYEIKNTVCPSTNPSSRDLITVVVDNTISIKAIFLLHNYQ